MGEVYATTVLPLMAEATAALDRGSASRCPVAAPACSMRRIAQYGPRAEPLPQRSIVEMLAFGQSLLGVPYLWGGVTARGLDCSGLAQLCYRYTGVTILRDADQQYASMPYMVERGDLRAGDLVFFARDGRIVHVGVMLDASQMLHADGSVRHQVTINALDPDARGL